MRRAYCSFLAIRNSRQVPSLQNGAGRSDPNFDFRESEGRPRHITFWRAMNIYLVGPCGEGGVFGAHQCDGGQKCGNPKGEEEAERPRNQTYLAQIVDYCRVVLN